VFNELKHPRPPHPKTKTPLTSHQHRKAAGTTELWGDYLAKAFKNNGFVR
jgi:hypothetical protein